MKQKNTEIPLKKQIRSAIISSIMTVCYQIVISLVMIWILRGSETGPIIAVVAWLVLIGAVIQVLAMPPLTWWRIKELKGGELNEARKY